MPETPRPLDAALDLLVFAPVGLALTAAEELPKLAAKGRQRVHTRFAMAKVVGEFAVNQGRRTLGSRLSAAVPPTNPFARQAWTPPSPPAPAPAGPVGHRNGSPTSDSATDITTNGSAVSVAESPEPTPSATAAGSTSSAPSPSAGDLAIPGYDSLSASQVVQRLAGLSRDERAAVGAYESAHRGRRTILNRIEQLQEP